MLTGTTTVSGPHDFDATVPPLVTLSGALGTSDPMLTNLSIVLAFDLDELGLNALGLTFTGANVYSLLLPPGFYIVAASVDIDPGVTPVGFLTYEFPEQSLELTANRTLDFLVPPLQIPASVVMSGTVTDENGQPVSHALVTASTSMLTTMPNLQFIHRRPDRPTMLDAIV